VSDYFKPSDPGVRDIAAIFALKGWTWGGPGLSREHTPKAKEIAEKLNRLHASAQRLGGNSHSGRLFVQISADDPEVTYGIEWGWS
jgi:hypothetical protein